MTDTSRRRSLSSLDLPSEAKHSSPKRVEKGIPLSKTGLPSYKKVTFNTGQNMTITLSQSKRSPRSRSPRQAINYREKLEGLVQKIENETYILGGWLGGTTVPRGEGETITLPKGAARIYLFLKNIISKEAITAVDYNHACDFIRRECKDRTNAGRCGLFCMGYRDERTVKLYQALLDEINIPDKPIPHFLGQHRRRGTR